MRPFDHAIRNALVRIPSACRAKGISPSTFYCEVNAGLTTQPIKIGPRAAAVPAYELEALNAARIAGATNDEIRALVTRLHSERKTGAIAK